MRKKIGHRDCSPWAHSELTVSSQWTHRELAVTKMVTASRDWAMTWAVIELWPSRDWAVIILRMLWLSCDLAVTELWPSRDWAVTSPWLSCDLSYHWALIIGPGAVTTVVTVSSRWAHSSLWAHGDNFFLMGWYLEANFHQWFMLWTVWNRPMGPSVIRCTPSISNHLPTLRRLLLIKVHTGYVTNSDKCFLMPSLAPSHQQPPLTWSWPYCHRSHTAWTQRRDTDISH